MSIRLICSRPSFQSSLGRATTRGICAEPACCTAREEKRSSELLPKSSDIQFKSTANNLDCISLPPWAGGLDDQEVARRSAEKKVWVWPLSPCYVGAGTAWCHFEFWKHHARRKSDPQSGSSAKPLPSSPDSL